MTHLYPPAKQTAIARLRGIAILAFVTASFWPVAVFSQEDSARFHARFADGTTLHRETLHAWHAANATPRLGPHLLFDDKNPAKWLMRDLLGPVPQPMAFVEFAGGDRLPGVVVSAASSGEMLHKRPEHLLVEPTAALRRPNSEQSAPLRIALEHVRRIVWQAREVTAPPSTAVRRDGSQVAFRALRWSRDSLALLTDSEIVTIPYDRLAEVRLPPGDAWQAYLDHAAALLPDGEGRLIQLETDSGLVALASTERLRPETYGDNRYTANWYQIIQPAWSLDPFWVRFPDIRLWRMFPPDRVPLTLLAPRVERTGVFFSDAIGPTTNQTRDGGQLRDGLSQHGWGFATHAPCDLIIPVPVEARAVESEFGLDPIVGSGGCALARIELRKDDKSSLLFESEPLIGSAPAQSTGRLPIPEEARGPGNTLHLIADPLVEERPPGADPFDIRDSLNWYGPTLELDPTAIRDELGDRALQRIAPLKDWTFLADSTTFARVMAAWSTRDWDDPRFQSSVLVEQGWLGLKQEMAIPVDARYLAVLVHSPKAEDAAPTQIQARINGEPIAELAVPVLMGRREPDPLLFPIEEFAGQTVSVELFQLPANMPSREAAPVEWIGIAPVSRRPGLRNLLADSPPELAEFFQDGAFIIGPPGVAAPRVPGWKFSITEEPKFGEYRYVQWRWSAAAPGPIALAFAHHGEFGTSEEAYVPPPRIREQPARGEDRGTRNGYRYVTGTPDSDNPAFSPAIALDDPPTGEMQQVQRDLYNDFGPFDITGLAVAVEQDSVHLDGLWLARNPDQFRHIKDAHAGVPTPEKGTLPVLLETGDPLAFAPLLKETAPSFTFSGRSAQLSLLKTYENRANVLRTKLSAENGQASGQFTTIINIPPQGTAEFHAGVLGNIKPDGKAVLRVLVDGKTLHEQDLPDEWADIDIGLDEYAGQTIRLELQFVAPGRSRAEIFWQHLSVEHENPAKPG